VDAVAEFGALVAAGARPLDRALALVASVGRPAVDASALVSRMDALAEDLPGTDAAGLCAAVFRGLGFTGNRDDYYDPDNSLLDRVLDRRTGIPITLSVLAMELGRRRGVDLVGVGMPGHFLLRDAHDRDLFVDAFDGGRVIDAEGCRSLFGRLHGASTPFSDEYLQPSDPTDIVVRVLNNLRAARLRRGDRHGLADVLRLQAALPEAGIAERRQLAGVLAAEGRFVEAADLYDGLSADDEARADEHRAAAVRLRANLN
jgi:regulator of sirC expression with transglutaminase-like and TPR domain